MYLGSNHPSHGSSHHSGQATTSSCLDPTKASPSASPRPHPDSILQSISRVRMQKRKAGHVALLPQPLQVGVNPDVIITASKALCDPTLVTSPASFSCSLFWPHWPHPTHWARSCLRAFALTVPSNFPRKFTRLSLGEAFPNHLVETLPA